MYKRFDGVPQHLVYKTAEQIGLRCHTSGSRHKGQDHSALCRTTRTAGHYAQTMLAHHLFIHTYLTLLSTSQEVGWEEFLQNNLYCAGWDAMLWVLFNAL